VTFNISLSTTTLLMLLAPRVARQTGRGGDRAQSGPQPPATAAGDATSERTRRRRREAAGAADDDDNSSALVIFDSATGRYGQKRLA
jgi:hypothetical protein